MNRHQLFKKIDSFNDELINLRRHIHAHPELSGLENQTAILISGYLKKMVFKLLKKLIFYISMERKMKSYLITN